MPALLLDVDTGIDDALALAYGLAHPDAELVAVVATYGNVTAPEAARNSRYLLDLLGAPQVPVHLGLDRPGGAGPYDALEISRQIHGHDGIAGLAPTGGVRPLNPVPGVQALVEAVARYGPDLTIVTTGPLTDLAAVVEQVDLAAAGIRVVVMGGAVRTRGNVTATAEVNVWHDPAATNAVLGAGLDLTLVGLDVTMRTLLRRTDIDPWRTLGEPGRVLGGLVDHYADVYDLFDPSMGGCGVHDPLAVGVALDPTLVRTRRLPLTVEDGSAEHGRTHESAGGVPVDVALEVEADRFRDDLITLVATLLTRLTP